MRAEGKTLIDELFLSRWKNREEGQAVGSGCDVRRITGSIFQGSSAIYGFRTTELE